MKKLLFLSLMLIFAGIDKPSAQDLAQMAQEQIERIVDLPKRVVLYDSTRIKRSQLDKLVMQLPVNRNGRIAVMRIVFLNHSLEAVDNLFLYAVRQVKLPKELVTKGELLTVAIQLKFEKMNYSAPSYSPPRIIVGVPPYYYDHSATREFYLREIEARLGRTHDEVREYVNSEWTTPRYIHSKNSVRQFDYRVTLVKSK